MTKIPMRPFSSRKASKGKKGHLWVPDVRVTIELDFGLESFETDELMDELVDRLSPEELAEYLEVLKRQ